MADPQTYPRAKPANAADPVADLSGKNGGRPPAEAAGSQAKNQAGDQARRREIGGPSGPEPTRYGDWERNGRVSDF